jgi:hypothetical protein
MPNRLSAVALVAVLMVAHLGTAVPARAADGSVRFLTAGPVRLGDGHIAHMRVFLPSVQRPVHVHFLGEGGALLKTLELPPPDRKSGPFFEVVFEARFTASPRGVGGTLGITDGTSNTIFSGESNGIIAILIGLRGDARGIGTMQVTDSAGVPVFILPYIEQDNLFR